MAANWPPGTKSLTQATTLRPHPTGENATLPWIRSTVAKCPPSQDFSKQSVVHFKNHSSVVVQLIWVDFSGNRQPNYGSLQPGEDRKQATGAGHAWLIADAAGNELGHFVAGERGPRRPSSPGRCDRHLERSNGRTTLAVEFRYARLGLEPGRHTNRDRRRQGLGDSHGKASRQAWAHDPSRRSAWSPDGKRLAAARFDQSLEISRLCVWNFETKSLAVRRPSARASLKFASVPTARAC